MSSIITSALKVTFGMLWTKARDGAANQLKEGDLNDEKCRQLIVRELDDIKTKLDGMARTSLCSSVNFLNEGICELNFCLGKSSYPEEQTGDASEAEGSIVTETGKLEDCEQSEISQAWPSCSTISLAISRLSNISEDSVVRAKASFKTARKEATRAFSNDALSTEDRILATKLRVISRILELFENPDAAANACIGYLKALHDTPAVREIFSVYLHGGIKARFNKAKRVQHVVSVTMVNFVLFHFICHFTKIAHDLLNWPRIETDEETYHPVIANLKILKKMKQTPEAQPNNEIITSRFHDFSISCNFMFAVNSKREIVGCRWKNGIEVVVYNTTTCEWRLLGRLSKEETGVTDDAEVDILRHSLDRDDHVYTILKIAEIRVHHLKLFVFDANGKLKFQSSLEFLDARYNIGLAVSADGTMIIYLYGGSRIWVVDQTGQLKHNVCLEDIPTYSKNQHVMCVTDKNEIIFSSLTLYMHGVLCSGNLHVFTLEGKFIRKINISAIEKTAEASERYGVTFNHITKTVLHLEGDDGSYSLSSYSKTGEKQDFLKLPHWITHPKLICHPSGVVALVHTGGVMFIR